MDTSKKEINLLDYLNVLVKWRKLIILNCVVIVVIAVIISLLLPKWYTAETTLLPPTQDTELIDVSAFLQGSPLANLGIPQLTTPSDIFVAILESRNIKSALVKKFELQKVYNTETQIDAIEALDTHTTIEVYETGIISIKVEDKDSVRAAELANSYVTELDRFNKNSNITRAKRNRIFIEKRLEETQQRMKLTEERLREFQEKHRTVSLPDETKAAITAAADIKAQKIALEVKLGVIQQYSTDQHPEVIQLKSQINQLQNQLKRMEYGEDSENDSTGYLKDFGIPFAQIPSVGLELARLTRDVKIQEEVFSLLTAQYEQARIQEARDTPTVQVLDEAIPPEIRSRPQRRLIVLISGAASLFIGIFLAFLLEYFTGIDPNSEQAKKWRTIFDDLKNDFRLGKK